MVVSNIFYFSPLFGEESQFWLIFFNCSWICWRCLKKHLPWSNHHIFHHHCLGKYLFGSLSPGIEESQIPSGFLSLRESIFEVMSLHLGVLVYGLAEGTLHGPAAAQSLTRMISDSSIEEVAGNIAGIHKRGRQKKELKHANSNLKSNFYFEKSWLFCGLWFLRKNQPPMFTRNFGPLIHGWFFNS